MSNKKARNRVTLRTREHRALIAVVVAARNEQGVTQQQLATRVAELFDVSASRSWIGKFEAQERGLDAVELMWIESALKLESGTLMARATQQLGKSSSKR